MQETSEMSDSGDVWEEEAGGGDGGASYKTLGARLPWGEGTHLSGEAFTSDDGGAPHVCSRLPYLNPALPLLVCRRSLKCLVGFKSC